MLCYMISAFNSAVVAVSLDHVWLCSVSRVSPRDSFFVPRRDMSLILRHDTSLGLPHFVRHPSRRVVLCFVSPPSSTSFLGGGRWWGNPWFLHLLLRNSLMSLRILLTSFVGYSGPFVRYSGGGSGTRGSALAGGQGPGSLAGRSKFYCILTDFKSFESKTWGVNLRLWNF